MRSLGPLSAVCRLVFSRRSLATALASALITSGCAPADEDAGSVRVGVLLPFTGEGAGVAANFERAAMMVADQINAAGGIHAPRDGHNGRLELVTLDTASDVDRSLDALDRLLAEGVVAVVGPESSEIALPMQLALAQEQVVFVSPLVSSGTQPKLTAENAWYRFGPSTVVTGRAMAYDILDAGFPRVAIMHSTDDYHAAIATELADRLTREGGEVVVTIPLHLQSLSYPDQVRALFEHDFDAVALVAPPKAAAQVVNEVDFLGDGVHVQYFLPPSLETDVFLRNTSAVALQGARGIRAQTADDPAFVEAFRAYANDDTQAGTYFYYDAMMVLALALATAHHFEFGLTPSGRVAVLPLATPRTEVPYPELVRFVRYVSERNGIRTTWNEVERATELIRSGDTVFYQGLTGPMVQAVDGQRNAAGTQVWVVDDGAIQRLAPTDGDETDVETQE